MRSSPWWRQWGSYMVAVLDDALVSRSRFVHKGRPGHSRHSSEEGAIALALQHINRLVRQSDALLLERLKAGIQVGEAELQTQAGGQRLEDAAARGDDFTADAVAGDQACRPTASQLACTSSN